MMEASPPPVVTAGTSSGVGAPNCRFCLSINGLLKSLEMLFGVIASFSAGVYCTGGSCNTLFYETSTVAAYGQGFVVFVTGMTTLFSFIFWFVHFFTAEGALGRSFVKQFEGLFYFVFGVLLVIAAIVESWYSTTSTADNMKIYHGQWIASAIFTWLLLFTYVYDLFRQFQIRRE